MPLAMMDCASSARRSCWNKRRGCNGLASIQSISTLFVISGVDSREAADWRVGRSALRPLPSTLRALSGLLTVQKLLCQLYVAFSALGAGVISQNRLAETWRLGEANTTWNDGLEDLIFKKVAQVRGNLPGQIGAVVEHR